VGAGDYFGYEVALSADTAIVASGSSSASAYIFVRSGFTTWTEQQKIVAPDSDAGFGFSVAISGDTVIVGACAYGTTGSAYIFVVPDRTNIFADPEEVPASSSCGEPTIAVSPDTPTPYP
jgi:hypothetical protein